MVLEVKVLPENGRTGGQRTGPLGLDSRHILGYRFLLRCGSVTLGPGLG